jgi:outer membrane protein assembly factor BamD (BamD/ComL family)
MSIIGILSSNLFSAGAAQNTQSSQGGSSLFQQIKTEFQQLGQDLQSGNLTQAQSDFTTLSQNLSSASQAGATAANPAAAGNSIAQAFSQLGQDLQSGNLQGAQQDFTNLQQDVQQAAGQQQVGGHHGHHHHHAESAQSSSSSSSSSSSQQTNSLVQAFSSLAQDLQAGNLSGAQSAFSALQNDLQQIGGFLQAESGGTSGAAVPAVGGNLNVSA